MMGYIILRSGKDYHPLRLYKDNLNSEVVRKIFNKETVLPLDGLKISDTNLCGLHHGNTARITDFIISSPDTGKIESGGVNFLEKK